MTSTLAARGARLTTVYQQVAIAPTGGLVTSTPSSRLPLILVFQLRAWTSRYIDAKLDSGPHYNRFVGTSEQKISESENPIPINSFSPHLLPPLPLLFLLSDRHRVSHKATFTTTETTDHNINNFFLSSLETNLNTSKPILPPPRPTHPFQLG